MKGTPTYEKDGNSIRSFENTNKDETRDSLKQELKSFEQSQDNDVLKNLYRTEIQDMLDRWRVLKQKAEANKMEWSFNPVPFLKENNRFWNDLFADPEDFE